MATRQNPPICSGRSLAGTVGGIQGSAATTALARVTTSPAAMPHSEAARTMAGYASRNGIPSPTTGCKSARSTMEATAVASTSVQRDGVGRRSARVTDERDDVGMEPFGGWDGCMLAVSGARLAPARTPSPPPARTRAQCLGTASGRSA